MTTAVDAGSAGASTFQGLRRYVIEASATRLFALLNISRIGMVSGAELEPPLGELEDLRHLNVPAAVRCIEANRDLILGVKLRLSANLAADGKNELQALKLAREAADAVGLPLMIHTPQSSLGLPAILARAGVRYQGRQGRGPVCNLTAGAAIALQGKQKKPPADPENDQRCH